MASGRANNMLQIPLGGRALRSDMTVGDDDETKGKGSLFFRVVADGTLSEEEVTRLTRLVERIRRSYNAGI